MALQLTGDSMQSPKGRVRKAELEAKLYEEINRKMQTRSHFYNAAAAASRQRIARRIELQQELDLRSITRARSGEEGRMALEELPRFVNSARGALNVQRRAEIERPLASTARLAEDRRANAAARLADREGNELTVKKNLADQLSLKLYGKRGREESARFVKAAMAQLASEKRAAVAEVRLLSFKNEAAIAEEREQLSARKQWLHDNITDQRQFHSTFLSMSMLSKQSCVAQQLESKLTQKGEQVKRLESAAEELGRRLDQEKRKLEAQMHKEATEASFDATMRELRLPSPAALAFTPRPPQKSTRGAPLRGQVHIRRPSKTTDEVLGAYFPGV